MKDRLWIPVPAKAIPIRIAYEARDDLDILERSILRLLRVRLCTAADLAARLGFADLELSESVGPSATAAGGRRTMRAALRGLVDRALAVSPPHAPGYYGTSTDEGEIASSLVSGWAFYVPHTGDLLSTIVAAARLPEWSGNAECLRRETPAPETRVAHGRHSRHVAATSGS